MKKNKEEEVKCGKGEVEGGGERDEIITMRVCFGHRPGHYRCGERFEVMFLIWRRGMWGVIVMCVTVFLFAFSA